MLQICCRYATDMLQICYRYAAHYILPETLSMTFCFHSEFLGALKHCFDILMRLRSACVYFHNCSLPVSFTARATLFSEEQQVLEFSSSQNSCTLLVGSFSPDRTILSPHNSHHADRTSRMYPHTAQIHISTFVIDNIY
jgi:hypothetical protein